MSAAHRATPRVPGTVAAAAVLIALNVVTFGVFTVQALIGGHWYAVVPFAFGVAEALVCVGLWRGHRAAYVAAIVLGAVIVLGSLSYVEKLATGGGLVGFLSQIGYGTLLLGLLVIPAAARQHFLRVH